MFKFNEDRTRIKEISGEEAKQQRGPHPLHSDALCSAGVCRVLPMRHVPAATHAWDAPSPQAVYRSAFAEDMNEMGERVLAQEGGFRELRLKRLV